MKQEIFVVFLACLSASVADKSDLNACTYTADNGKVYNLSPLISSNDNAYTWSQTVLDTSDNLLTNPDFSNNVQYNFQLQICRNITKPMNTACNVTSPAYMMDPSTKTCLALGSLDVATFEPNPFMDGVYLDYYNGGAVSHIVRYEARVYFVCMANVTLDGPHFEHMKDSSAVHFRVNTKYACVQ